MDRDKADSFYEAIVCFLNTYTVNANQLTTYWLIPYKRTRLLLKKESIQSLLSLFNKKDYCSGFKVNNIPPPCQSHGYLIYTPKLNSFTAWSCVELGVRCIL